MIRRIIDFLNANAGALNLVFAFIVAMATVFYAILTRSLVRETKLLREAQTEPQVTVRVEPSEVWINLINLVIENNGAAPALDIKLSAEPDFESTAGHHLSEFGLFKHGMRVLGPKQRISVRIANVVGKTEEIRQTNGRYQFCVNAKYRSALGRTYDHSFEIDFRHMIGLSQGTPPIHSVAKSLEELQRDLHKIASGFYRVKAIVYTPEQVEREDEEAMERLKEATGNEDSS